MAPILIQIRVGFAAPTGKGSTMSSIFETIKSLSSQWSNFHPTAEMSSPIRLTIVQAGDYAEATDRFLAGGEENYYAQRYTVDFVASLARLAKIEEVTVICFTANVPQTVTASGVRTMGIELYPKGRRAQFGELVEAIASTRPTHLVVASPIVQAIHWGLRRKIPVLPLFADSFRASGVKSCLKNRRLAFLLNHREIDLVANHNLAAALDLAQIGVHRDKIVPFDWPALVSVKDYPPKPAPPTDRPFRMLYVGKLTEAKGTRDTIEALSILRARGLEAHLTLIGSGESEALEALARQRGVAAHVALAGRKSHRQVLSEMRAHDVILVPSHHAYPEGLPMTLYEALCVRTPLIISDHPMFAHKIRSGQEALVHVERDPAGLADHVERLASDKQLYEELSRRAETTVHDYLCPLKWDQLLEGFLNAGERRELRRYSLMRYPYLHRPDAAADSVAQVT